MAKLLHNKICWCGNTATNAPREVELHFVSILLDGAADFGHDRLEVGLLEDFMRMLGPLLPAWAGGSPQGPFSQYIGHLGDHSRRLLDRTVLKCGSSKSVPRRNTTWSTSEPVLFKNIYSPKIARMYPKFDKIQHRFPHCLFTLRNKYYSWYLVCSVFHNVMHR